MRPTLNDIAKRAQVNASTVSRILSNNTDFPVSAAKRDKVLRIARELNYEPKRAARSLVSGKTYTVAAVLGSLERDITSPTFSHTLAELARELLDAGYSLNLLPVNDSKSLDEEVLRTLRATHADAYFVPYSFLQPKTLCEFKRTGTPVVSLHGPPTHDDHGVVGYIRLDEQPANDELARQLIRLSHQRVLCFGAEQVIRQQRRFEPFHDAVRRLAPANELVVDQLDYQPANSGPMHDRHEAKVVAATHFDTIRSHTAVLCGSDLTAMGLIDMLEERGLTPGVDISIVGHDNIEDSTHFQNTQPFLATIDRRSGPIGRTIARLILDSITGSVSTPAIRHVPLRFICRASLGPAIPSPDSAPPDSTSENP